MELIVRRISTHLLTIATCLIGFVAPASAQGVHVEVTDSYSSGRVYGWEHNLTERDPNLSHWHWEPIGASSHQRNVRKYVDPTTTTASEPQEIVRTHYIKPIHVALPVTAHNPNPVNSTASSTADLNGKLLRKSHGAAVIAQTKAVATYADYSKSGSGRDSFASAVKTQVAGNIVHVSGRKTSYNEAPKTY